VLLDLYGNTNSVGVHGSYLRIRRARRFKTGTDYWRSWNLHLNFCLHLPRLVYVQTRWKPWDV